MHHFRAIHLCTGERRDDLRVRDWLTRHGVDYVSFADPYAAAVHVLRHASRVPQLAFVGIDALDSAELQVLEFIHETWPGLVQIAYGADTPNIAAGAGVVQTYSSRALESLLQAQPVDLVAQAAGAWQPLAGDAPAESLPPMVQTDAAPATNPIAAGPAARSGIGCDAPPPTNSGALADVITPDELSVLLGDDE